MFDKQIDADTKKSIGKYVGNLLEGSLQTAVGSVISGFFDDDSADEGGEDDFIYGGGLFD